MTASRVFLRLGVILRYDVPNQSADALAMPGGRAPGGVAPGGAPGNPRAAQGANPQRGANPYRPGQQLQPVRAAPHPPAACHLACARSMPVPWELHARRMGAARALHALLVPRTNPLMALHLAHAVYCMQHAPVACSNQSLLRSTPTHTLNCVDMC